MKLDSFEKHAYPKIIRRGKDYFRSGAIVHFEEKGKSGSNKWHAFVEGQQNDYEVEVHLTGQGQITFIDCDCPYDHGGICKHLVAVLLKIREQVSKPTVELDRSVVPKMLSVEAQLLHYPKLQASEQRFIKICALYLNPLDQEKLITLFNESQFKFEGRKLRPKDFSNIISTLISQSLIQLKSNNFHINRAFADAICQLHYNQDPDFKKIGVAIIRQKPKFYFWDGRDNQNFHFRAMRVARYSDDPNSFETHFLKILDDDFYSSSSVDIFELLEYWLGADPNQAKWESFPPGIQAFLARECLKLDLFFHDFITPDVITYLEGQLKFYPEPLQMELGVLFAQHHILRGQLDAINAILPFLTPPLQQDFLAILLFLRGDYAQSLDIFNKTERHLQRNKTEGHALHYSSIIYVFHQLARLQSRKPVALKKTLKIPTHTHLYFADALDYIRATSYFLLNDLPTATDILEFEESALVFGFFRLLSTYWVDADLLDLEEIESYINEFESLGFNWISEELKALAQEYGAPTQPQKAANLPPLYQLIPRIEQWQNALQALENLVAKRSASSGERLVWLVDFDQKEVQGKHQTLSKNGWTKGRTVSYDRLRKGELTFMTAQDQRFVKAVQFAHGSIFYLKHEIETWKHLIDHPLLFHAKSPKTPVQLVQAKPTLIAEDKGDDFLLRFNYPFREAGAQLIKETASRYLYLEVGEQLVQIVSAFGKPILRIPKTETKKLKPILGELSDILPVQSTLVQENLPQRPPDPTIHVHLLPIGDGFHIETFVKPLKVVSPYLKPGKGEPYVIGLIDGQRTGTNRDLKSEQQQLKQLKAACPVLQQHKPKKEIWKIEDTETCLQLLTELAPLVEEKTIIVEWPKGELLQVSSTVGFEKLNLNIQKRGHWFEADGNIEIDEEQVLTFRELLALSEGQTRFIEISPGKFLALSREFHEKLKSINGILHSSGKKDAPVQLHPLALPAVDEFTKSVKQLTTDKAFQDQGKRLEQAFTKSYRVPKSFNAQLRPYQKAGFQWLNRCAAWGVGACLADDMGLGKTIQALAFLSKHTKKGPALVVAPASVCRNWRAETERFSPNLSPILFNEVDDRQQTLDQAKNGDLVIVTYDLMAREAILFTQKKWGTVVLDEAQAIKNKATNRSKTAMALQADFRLAMSGTPLENNLSELWNLFNFLNPGLLGSAKQFQERFAVPIEKFKDENKRDQLRRLVQPFILRRLKREVLKDLPEKTEITLTVELSPPERAHYEALRRRAMAQLIRSEQEKQIGQQHLEILAELMRLRRAACHPGLVDNNHGITKSAKLELFGEIVDELLENDHKALVFSQFVDHLKILRKHLDAKNIRYQYLDGKTPGKKRQQAIDAFQAGEGDLFLISLKAGGTGLNLTAADYVIHTDPWWNPAVEDQATDRAHRIGQQRPVTVYRLVAAQTIEEKIIALHAQKRDLADSLLAGTDVSAKLSLEDLKGLLKES